MLRFFFRNVTTHLIILIMLSGCSFITNTQSDDKKHHNVKSASEPVPVTIMQIEKSVIARTLDVIVPLVGQQQSDVYSRVVGRISWLGPDEGKRVRIGETLFKVDRQEPGESFLSVPVVSPISGFVGRWNVTLGTQVNIADPVVLVVDDKNLRATVSLPVAEWSKIKRDTQVTLDIYGIKYRAKIETIARAADAGSGRGTFVLSIPNPNEKLRSGMVAIATIYLEPHDRIIVPSNSLRISDQGAFVYIAENNKAKRIDLMYSSVSNDKVELLSGVKQGDKLILAGNNMVFDGAPIKIIMQYSDRQKGSEQ